MCPNFNREYQLVAALQRRKLNMFLRREGKFSPRVLVRGNPARAKFAAENYSSSAAGAWTMMGGMTLRMIDDVTAIDIGLGRRSCLLVSGPKRYDGDGLTQLGWI